MPALWRRPARQYGTPRVRVRPEKFRAELSLSAGVLTRNDENALSERGTGLQPVGFQGKADRDRRLRPTSRTVSAFRHRSPSPRGLERACPPINNSCSQSSRAQSRCENPSTEPRVSGYSGVASASNRISNISSPCGVLSTPRQFLCMRKYRFHAHRHRHRRYIH